MRCFPSWEVRPPNPCLHGLSCKALAPWAAICTALSMPRGVWRAAPLPAYHLHPAAPSHPLVVCACSAGDDEASVRVSQAAERVASLLADPAKAAEVDAFFERHKARSPRSLLAVLRGLRGLLLQSTKSLPSVHRALSDVCVGQSTKTASHGRSKQAMHLMPLACVCLRCARRSSRATRALQHVPRRASLQTPAGWRCTAEKRVHGWRRSRRRQRQEEDDELSQTLLHLIVICYGSKNRKQQSKKDWIAYRCEHVHA